MNHPATDPAAPASPGSAAAEARAAARACLAGSGAPPALLPAGTISPGLLKIARAMSEDELLLKITLGTKREPGICTQLGLGWVHHRRSKMTNPGWPDLVIKAPAGRSGILIWELKTMAGKVTPEQQEWLDALVAAGFRAGVRRPSDLLSGRIARELAALAGIGGRP